MLALLIIYLPRSYHFSLRSEYCEMIGSIGLLTTDKLVALKQNAKSRANFAVLLLKELFNPKELEGKNIVGVRGKDMVDPERITKIKKCFRDFIQFPLRMRIPVGVCATRKWTNNCIGQPGVVRE